MVSRGTAQILLLRNIPTNTLARVGADQVSEEVRPWLYCSLQCRIEILRLVWVIETIERSLLLCQQAYSGVWAGSLRPARANCDTLEDWAVFKGEIVATFHKHSKRCTLNKNHLLQYSDLCSKAHYQFSRRNVLICGLFCCFGVFFNKRKGTYFFPKRHSWKWPSWLKFSWKISAWCRYFLFPGKLF